MVYCGKPSKGCQLCRDRKTRCDKATPSCSQCVRAKRVCPGYRNQLDLMFRIENDGVIEKSKTREAAKAKKNGNGNGAGGASAKTTSPTVSFEGDRAASDSVWGGELVVKGSVPKSPVMSLDERARAWFLTINRPDWSESFDLDQACLAPDEKENAVVLASISAVGLASYSNSVQSTEVMTQARKTYVKALQLTNQALRDPVAVKNNSTLFAVMILGMFETVSGSCQDSLLTWTKHMDGAVALVKLRGLEQFATTAGQLMFFQVLSDSIASCWQRSVMIPQHILDLRNTVGHGINEEHPGWPGWVLVGNIIDVATLRVEILTSGTKAEDHIEKALALDARFQKLIDDDYAVWRYEIQHTAAGEMPNVVWDREYHIYPNEAALLCWNGIRSCRLNLHEIIRGQLPNCAPGYRPEQAELSAKVLRQMQRDILASVPHRCSTSPGGRSLRNGDPNGLVLWLLYLVAVMDQTTEEVRAWVVQRLRGIASEVGMPQAYLLAEHIKRMKGDEVGCLKPFGSKHYALEEGMRNFNLRENRMKSPTI